MEKVALKRVRKKAQSKVDKIWNFIKSQCAGSFIAPPDFSPTKDAGDDNAKDDGDDQCGTPNVGDGSQS